MSDSKAAPNFPYDHLAVLGIEKLTPYKGRPAAESTPPYRQLEGWIWEITRQIRKQAWEEREYSAERQRIEDEVDTFRKNLAKKLIPKATCCPQAKHLFAYDHLNMDGETLGPPRWRQSFYEDDEAYFAFRHTEKVTLDITFCPFCGARLPSFKLRKDPPPKISRTDGYYCQVCDQRAHACFCFPEITAWEIAAGV